MRWILIALFCWSFPVVAHAIEFTEIAYDLAGSDTGREWLEVHNETTEIVDLTGWLLNDGSNHTFKADRLTLSPDERAIIADDRAQFLLDHPNYSGLVIDSVVHLPNYQADNQEPFSLDLLDSTKTTRVSIAYLASRRGSEGYTLEKTADNQWQELAVGGSPGTGPVVPTPLPPAQLRLSEVFANPDGADTGKEWLELFNFGVVPVGLGDCRLSMASLTTSTERTLSLGSQPIEPNQLKVVPITEDSLLNGKFRLSLNCQNQQVDQLSFDSAIESGISLSLIDGNWQLSNQPTPGQANRLSVAAQVSSQPTKSLATNSPESLPSRGGLGSPAAAASASISPSPASTTVLPRPVVKGLADTRSPSSAKSPASQSKKASSPVAAKALPSVGLNSLSSSQGLPPRTPPLILLAAVAATLIVASAFLLWQYWPPVRHFFKRLRPP